MTVLRTYLQIVFIVTVSCCSNNCLAQSSYRIFFEPFELLDAYNGFNLRGGVEIPLAKRFSFIAAGGMYFNNNGFELKPEIRY